MHALIACLALLTPQGSPDFQRVVVHPDPKGNYLAFSIEIPKGWLETSRSDALTRGSFEDGKFESGGLARNISIWRRDLAKPIALEGPPDVQKAMAENQRKGQESQLRTHREQMERLERGEPGYALIKVGGYEGLVGEHPLYPAGDRRHRSKYFAQLKGPREHEWVYISMLAHKADLNEGDRKFFRRIVESFKPE